MTEKKLFENDDYDVVCASPLTLRFKSPSPYNGIDIEFGEIRQTKENEDGSAIYSLEYNITSDPELADLSSFSKEEFDANVTEIYKNLLTQAIDLMMQKQKDDGQKESSE